MNIVAMDISTKSGFCFTCGSGYQTEQLTKRKDEANDDFAVRLFEKVGEMCSRYPAPPFVIIEDYAFGAQGRAKTLLAELGGLVKYALHIRSVRFVTVTPTQWKAYILNSSHAKKEDIKTLVLKKFKQDFSDKSNDECDAYCMWLLARELVGRDDVRKNRTKAYDELRDRVQRMIHEGEADRIHVV